MNASMQHQEQPGGARAGSLESSCLWIEDEGLLRDEGVVFGLMRNPGALEEKEAAIRAFHRRRMAEEARRRHTVEAELAALLQRHARPVEAVRILDTAGAPQREEDAHAALVARDGLAMAAAAVTCAGLAAFVYELVQPYFHAPALVTAGVVGAGIFAALPTHAAAADGSAGRAGTRWARLVELGLPLAAALFVVAWAQYRLGPFRAGATGALLFLAFAFAGRQVLGTAFRLGAAAMVLGREWEQRRAEARARAGEMEPRALDEAVAALRREIATLRSVEEWEAICDTRLALFRSEYQLAAARSGQPGPHLLPPTSLFSANESH